jgi:hypothetical protein
MHCFWILALFALPLLAHPSANPNARGTYARDIEAHYHDSGVHDLHTREVYNTVSDLEARHEHAIEARDDFRIGKRTVPVHVPERNQPSLSIAENVCCPVCQETRRLMTSVTRAANKKTTFCTFCHNTLFRDLGENKPWYHIQMTKV